MLPLVNDAFETLKPYSPGKPVAETERELGIKGVIKLASNENPFGPSPRAMEAMRAALPQLHDYPDASCHYLRERLAAFLGVQPAQLMIGNGTNELIEILVRTCLRPGETLLFASPSFIVYKLITQAMGQTVREVPLRDMKFDLPALARAVDERTKLLFIANPNNPTGTYVTRAELEAFLAQLPPHVIVVMDEAYFEYAVAPDYPNGLDYLARRERFMVMRTFSKCYGLAGVRVGYAVGHPTLIDYMNRGRQPFNVNTLAQVAALAALDDVDHVTLSRQKNRVGMEALVPALTKRGLTVTPSQANFVLVDFHRPIGPVFDALLRQGVIVRPVDNYGLPSSARITIGTEPQNSRLIEAIDRLR
jgi:histidinol-phosphate aminotransferase